MPTALWADIAIIISDLKRRLTAALNTGHKALEDVELNRICDERMGRRSVKVSLDDL